MFKFFFKQARERARLLAGQLAEWYPSDVERHAPDQVPAIRLTRYLEETAARAVADRKELGLGWLGRAVYVNTVKWELKDAGYSDTFVDTVTEALVVHMMRA